MSPIEDTQTKRALKEKPDQKYASTLLLPTTNFPLRGDAVNREHLFRQRATSDLYAWQVMNIPLPPFCLEESLKKPQLTSIFKIFTPAIW